ncbi:hypothetical protein PRIPAC_89835 [Pristionchus pacificus]|uniref:Uncharacterized protein n=1 Tax=Pristionchus pacificus TaxID=54126 RepID=A0A454XJB5_PRIPA|nr:hypothetical protein PRIPAC_89835 [Pristionchus pacificus]|eukprot:PDM84876.1 hypothetical protein PRIPAC_33899 [Pristionchus pacificus]
MSDSQSVSFQELTKALEDLPLWGKTLVAGGVVVAFYLPYAWFTSNKRASPIKSDFKPGVVYLYQLPRTKELPSISASCLKLETWLRMAEIPYENVPCGLGTRGLDGAIPFIEVDGKEISHSALAIHHLKEKFSKGSLDDHLSDEQKATCHAFERLIHLSLASSHLIYRAENADKLIGLIPPANFGIFASIFSIFVTKAYLGRCASIISSSSLGGYSRDQRVFLGKEDIRSLSKYLGSKHFFTGFKPTSIDASIFASLSQILFVPYQSHHKQLLNDECANLVKFVDRMKSRFWPDWTEATTKFTADSNWKRKLSTPPNGSRAQTPQKFE